MRSPVNRRLVIMATALLCLTTSCSEPAPTQAEPDRIYQEAVISYRNSDLDATVATLEQALAIYRETGPIAMVGRTLNSMGGVYYQQGNYQQALASFQKSLEIRRQIGDKAGEAKTLNNMGLVYDKLKEKDRAIELVQQSQAIFQEINDMRNVEKTRDNLELLTPCPTGPNLPGCLAVGQVTILFDDDFEEEES
ncbi:MAG: tetratricopeptide repeat protein [Hormoscilla sp.]